MEEKSRTIEKIKCRATTVLFRQPRQMNLCAVSYATALGYNIYIKHTQQALYILFRESQVKGHVWKPALIT